MRSKAPLSVWLVQIVLTLTALCCLYVPFELLMRGTSIAVSSGAFLIVSGCTTFLGVTMIAIAKRRQYGRVLGLVALMAIYAFMVYVSLNPPPPSRGGYVPQSPAEEGWRNILDIIAFAFFSVLFFRFGFSKRSRAFFDKSLPPPNVSP